MKKLNSKPKRKCLASLIIYHYLPFSISKSSFQYSALVKSIKRVHELLVTGWNSSWALLETNSLFRVFPKVKKSPFTHYHTELDSGNTRVSTTGSVPARTPTPHNSGGRGCLHGSSLHAQPTWSRTVALSSCPLRVSSLVTELVQSTEPALTRWIEQHHVVSRV